MDEKRKQKLVDMVIDQIKHDIEIGDVTAIDELLHNVPENHLHAFMPDEDTDRYQYPRDWTDDLSEEEQQN